MNLFFIILSLVILGLLQSLLTFGFIFLSFGLISLYFHKDKDKWDVFFKGEHYRRLIYIVSAGLGLGIFVVALTGYGLFAATDTGHPLLLSVVPAVLGLPGFYKIYRRRDELRRKFAMPDTDRHE